MSERSYHGATSRSLLTLNAAYWPSEHMEVICHLCKMLRIGCDFGGFFFSPHGFVYMQIVKKVAGQQGSSF